jgi:hypothetical protein
MKTYNTPPPLSALSVVIVKIKVRKLSEDFLYVTSHIFAYPFIPLNNTLEETKLLVFYYLGYDTFSYRTEAVQSQGQVSSLERSRFRPVKVISECSVPDTSWTPEEKSARAEIRF